MTLCHLEKVLLERSVDSDGDTLRLLFFFRFHGFSFRGWLWLLSFTLHHVCQKSKPKRKKILKILVFEAKKS